MLFVVVWQSAAQIIGIILGEFCWQLPKLFGYLQAPDVHSSRLFGALKHDCRIALSLARRVNNEGKKEELYSKNGLRGQEMYECRQLGIR